MNNLLKFLQHTIIQKCVLVLFAVFVIFSFYLYANYASVNADASYYLGVSRLIMSNNVPFVDFRLHYSPLSFYLMCIPFSIFGISYACAIVTLLLVQLVNAFLVYKIFQKHNFSGITSCIGGMLYILYISLFSGYGYILEPFVLLFGLMAIYYVQSDSLFSLFFAGIFCACSVLCKQYGLGFIVLSIVYILLDRTSQKKTTRLLFCFFGFSIGLSVAAVLLLMQGVHLSQLWNNLQGSDYQREGLIRMVMAFGHVFIRMFPFIVTLWIPLFYWKKFKRDNFWIISLMGVVGFLLPLYVRPYLHYVILPLPFMIFFIFCSIRQVEVAKYKEYLILFVAIMAIMPILSMIQLDMKLIQGKNRVQQEQISEKIASFVPKEERDVYVSFNALYTSVVNSYTPPLLKEYGMSNGFVTMPRDVLKLLQNAKYAIISNEEYAGKNQNCSPRVKTYLKNNFILMSTVTGLKQEDVYVYKKIK